MPTTANHAIWTPASESNYNLTTDLAAMAASIDTAMVKSANAYKGTAAQREAFTAAPDGTLWSDTNGTRKLWMRQAGAWVAVGGSTAVQSWSEPESPASYAAPGWSVTSGVFYWKPGLAAGSVTVQRTGGAISVNAKGDITNQTVLTGLPARFTPMVDECGVGNGSTGRVASFHFSVSGLLRLTAVSPGANINTGDSLSASGVWATGT